VCGKQAEAYVYDQFNLIRSVRESLKHPKDVLKTIENLSTENSELKKRIEKLEAVQINSTKTELLRKAVQLNGTTFIGEVVEASSSDSLKKLCFDLRNELKNYVIVLASNIDGKAQVAIAIDEKISSSKNLDASKMIKEQVAPLIKGGGGGQKTLATAGGQDPSNLKQVIQKLKELL